jgi:hypothetical protein
MSSSDENAGRALLNRWNAVSAEIQVSFTTEGGAIGFRIEGIVSAFAEDRLFVSGSRCECFVNLSDGSFRDVVSREGLERLGLPTETYGESATVSLAPHGRCVLTALPQLRPDPRPN